jgi:hypothetical protein
MIVQAIRRVQGGSPGRGAASQAFFDGGWSADWQWPRIALVEICLFVRDGQTRRFLFNVKALQALGINAVEAHQRGYPIKEQPPMAEAEEDLTAA